MEPVSSALILTAATQLGLKVLDGVAGAAGEGLWNRILSAIGWSSTPKADELPRLLEERLRQPEVAALVAELLASQQAGPAPLVGTVNAEKVVVVQKIDTFNM